MTLKQLGEAWTKEMHKNSTVPTHAIPQKKFSDKDANSLTNAVLGYFELKHIKAWRQASEGRYMQEVKGVNVIGQTITLQKGRYIPRSKAAKGAADVTCSIPPLGRRLEIEVKFGKDRQSEVQKQFQKEIEEMGAIYIIVRTWEDFYQQIQKYVS